MGLLNGLPWRLSVVTVVICAMCQSSAASRLRDEKPPRSTTATTADASSLNTTELDCEMRRLALDFASHLLSWDVDDESLRVSKQQIYDALQLKNCHPPLESDPQLGHWRNIHSISNKTQRQQRKATATATATAIHHKDFSCPTNYCIFVTPTNKATSTTTATKDTSIPKNTTTALTASGIHVALHLSRHVLREPSQTSIVLQPGIHELEATLQLGPADSGLSFVGVSTTSTGNPEAWISGAISLTESLDWDYDCKINIHVRVANLTNLLQSRTLPRLPSLFSTNKRWNRARYPNGDFETTQWGYISPDRKTHSIGSDQVLRWHRPPPGEPPTFEYIDFQNNNPNLPLKNDSAMPAYNIYASGKGGVCADLWGPDVDSYWCSNASAGGWSEVDRECAVQGLLQIPVGLDYNISSELGQVLQSWGDSLRGGIIHAWHSQTWAMRKRQQQSQCPHF